MTILSKTVHVLCAAALAALAACSAPMQMPSAVQIAPTLEPLLPAAVPRVTESDVNAVLSAVSTAVPSEAILKAVQAPAGEADLAKLADSVIQPLVDTDAFAGAVLIARDAEIVLNEGYGYADRASKTLVDAGSRFYVSEAESWPALAAVLLQQQAAGALDLDDAVCKYSPICPEEYASVTFRQLLASGGDAWGAVSPALGDAGKLPAIPVGDAAQKTAELGAGIGSWMWGNLQAGMGADADLTTIASERVFRPLGLEPFDLASNPDVAKIVTLYDSMPPVEIPTTAYADAAVMSSKELNTFVQGLFDGTLLTPAQLEQMLTPLAPAKDIPGEMSRALGVYVGTDPSGRFVVSQVDADKGAGTYWSYYPDDELTIIVLNNLTDVANQPDRARDIGLELARQIFGK